MNRTTFSIIGGLIILILLAVWAYILFFKNGEGVTEEQPAEFTTFTPTTNNNFAPEPESTEQPLVDVTGEKEPLRQLTTRPIVGYQEVLTSSETAPLVYFIESGTGHIYSIDLGSGVEERLSQTTIPEARAGVITPNGFHTLVQSGSGLGSSYVVGSLSSTSKQLSTTILDGQLDNLAVSTDNTFFFTTPVGNGLEAKEYDPVTQTSSTLFQIPFREAVVRWGTTADVVHYMFPKANNQLEGYVYEVSGTNLTRLPFSGYGLTAIGNNEQVVYTTINNGERSSHSYNKSTGDSNQTASFVLSDKCITIADDTNMFVCATDESAKSDLNDAWYQGSLVFNDDLYLFDTKLSSGRLLIDIEANTGRRVDVIQPNYYPVTEHIYFKSKVDNTLWFFDPTLIK